MGIGSALSVHTPIKPNRGSSITSSQNTLPVLDTSVTSALRCAPLKTPLTCTDRDITKIMLIFTDCCMLLC